MQRTNKKVIKRNFVNITTVRTLKIENTEALFHDIRLSPFTQLGLRILAGCSVLACNLFFGPGSACIERTRVLKNERHAQTIKILFLREILS